MLSVDGFIHAWEIVDWDFAFSLGDLVNVFVAAGTIWLAASTVSFQKRQTEILDKQEKADTFWKTLTLVEHVLAEANAITDFQKRGEAPPESDTFISRHWPLYKDNFNEADRETVEKVISTYANYLVAKDNVSAQRNVEENNRKLKGYSDTITNLKPAFVELVNNRYS
jgi:hypothetical protein